MQTLMLGRHFFSLAVLTTVLAGGGCDQPRGGATAPDREAHYRRAKHLAEAKDFAGAAEALEKALRVNPDLAIAHLELGLLYDDKLGDPVSAIYHYRRYLTLKPDTDKRQLVLDFIERARLTLAAKLPQSPIVSPLELTRLQDEKAALLLENQELKKRVAELEATWSGRVSRPVTLTPIAPATPATPASETPRSRRHVVQKGDTLQSLALQYYGSRSAWEKIYQANRASLSSKDQLKVGQLLVIP